MLLNNPIFSQEKKNRIEGFGIEAGLGYNTMKIETFTFLGKDTTLKYNRFWMQPCIRLHYDFKIWKMGEKNSMKLKTILGYYSFGGKLKPDTQGNSEIISFGSIELAAGLAFDIGGFLQFTPSLKAQYVFSATSRPIRVNGGIPQRNIMKYTNPLASSAGLQIRYKFRRFTVAAEGWYGLTDLIKDKTKAGEINYRLMLGYEF